MSADPTPSASPDPAARRIGWIDDARGIGIVLVVVGHVLRGLEPAGILGDTAANRYADAWIYAFHMPLFFLLAGFFAERRVGRDVRTFLVEQAATIIYPYFLWSALQTGAQVAASGSVNKAIGLHELLGIPITPVMQFWFLYALFLIACIYQGLRRLGLGPAAVAVLFAVAWGATSAQPGLVPWYPLRAALQYGIFYSLGSLANARGRATEANPRSAAIIATALAGLVMVSIWPLAVTPATTAAIRIPGNLLVALGGSAATIALAMLASGTAASRPLAAWGRASLEIYVAHTICSAATRIVLAKLLKIHSPTIHVALGIILGIVLPMLLVLVSRRWNLPHLFRWPIRKPAAKPAAVSVR